MGSKFAGWAKKCVLGWATLIKTVVQVVPVKTMSVVKVYGLQISFDTLLEIFYRNRQVKIRDFFAWKLQESFV